MLVRGLDYSKRSAGAGHTKLVYGVMQNERGRVTMGALRSSEFVAVQFDFFHKDGRPETASFRWRRKAVSLLVVVCLSSILELYSEA